MQEAVNGIHLEDRPLAVLEVYLLVQEVLGNLLDRAAELKQFEQLQIGWRFLLIGFHQRFHVDFLSLQLMIEEVSETLGLHFLRQDHLFIRGLGFRGQVIEFLKLILAQ